MESAARPNRLDMFPQWEHSPIEESRTCRMARVVSLGWPYSDYPSGILPHNQTGENPQKEGSMKEKTVQFALTETTKQALLNACKGTYLAQARAVWEGHLVDASFRKIAAAIRDVYATADRKQSCGNEAIQGGLNAARLVALNGESLTEEARIQNIANGMRAAADEHAAKEAARREAKKKEKAAAAEKEAADKAAEEKAAACRKASDLLRSKVSELESWITDAQGKLETARGELEKALVKEAEETAQNVDQLTAFYASAGLPVPAGLVELIDTPEIQADLALAKKHAEFLAGVALARQNAEKAKEAEMQAAVATPAPIPEKDEVGEMLAEHSASMDAAIMAQSVARHARKANKKVA